MSDDFNMIGIYPNAATVEYCEKIIHRFEFLKETCSEGRGKIWTRQEHEEGIHKVQKDNETYFLGGEQGDELPLTSEDKVLIGCDSPLLIEFGKIVWACYDHYSNEYGILPSLGLHKLSPCVRIQKYEPTQGYHMWHCDAAGVYTSRRMAVVTLYLNTVEEGGETEFLYQRTRITPELGTLVFFPAGWTHTHRGNPTLKGNKYIITTWLEYAEW